MSGGMEWAALYEDKKGTEKLRVILKTHSPEEIYKMYKILNSMFEELLEDAPLMRGSTVHQIQSAHASFNNIFTKKRKPPPDKPIWKH